MYFRIFTLVFCVFFQLNVAANAQISSKSDEGGDVPGGESKDGLDMMSSPPDDPELNALLENLSPTSSDAPIPASNMNKLAPTDGTYLELSGDMIRVHCNPAQSAAECAGAITNILAKIADHPSLLKSNSAPKPIQ